LVPTKTLPRFGDKYHNNEGVLLPCRVGAGEQSSIPRTKLTGLRAEDERRPIYPQMLCRSKRFFTFFGTIFSVVWGGRFSSSCDSAPPKRTFFPRLGSDGRIVWGGGIWGATISGGRSFSVLPVRGILVALFFGEPRLRNFGGGSGVGGPGKNLKKKKKKVCVNGVLTLTRPSSCGHNRSPGLGPRETTAPGAGQPFCFLKMHFFPPPPFFSHKNFPRPRKQGGGAASFFAGMGTTTCGRPCGGPRVFRRTNKLGARIFWGGAGMGTGGGRFLPGGANFFNEHPFSGAQFPGGPRQRQKKEGAFFRPRVFESFSTDRWALWGCEWTGAVGPFASVFKNDRVRRVVFGGAGKREESCPFACGFLFCFFFWALPMGRRFKGFAQTGRGAAKKKSGALLGG